MVQQGHGHDQRNDWVSPYSARSHCSQPSPLLLHPLPNTAGSPVLVTHVSACDLASGTYMSFSL